jgi:signal transduction histidine kinase
MRINDTLLDETQRAYTETICQSGRNLLVIINDILDFSKVESGTVTIDPQPFDLREAVTRGLDLLAPHPPVALRHGPDEGRAIPVSE